MWRGSTTKLTTASVLTAASIFIAWTWSRPQVQPSPHATRNHVKAHASSVELLRVHVLKTYPHDSHAFTQGLLWKNGLLYESTGLEGKSGIRATNVETNQTVRVANLDAHFFGEGLALVGDRLVQLTWKNSVALVWSAETFEHEKDFAFEGEGWGLCYNGSHLVMSDGTEVLSFRSPETFDITKQVHVDHYGSPVRSLNELECVDGLVYANIWQTNRIVRIDPRTGHVTGIIDASGLLSPEEQQTADVLNGIAWIPERQHFLLTGKLWPHTFEVEFLPYF